MPNKLHQGGPLAGIRVVEIANVVAGPTACQILGDFGAEIIKVEHPIGDGMRRQGPTKNGAPLWWKVVGRNKRSVGMRLGDSEVNKHFKSLLKDADVLVEGFRPGTLERWGLAPDDLMRENPKLIIARLSGFGQEGPKARRPAFGTLIEAMTGFAHMTGDPNGPPTLPPLALADYFAGISAATAITMALFHREARGGAGQIIDLSIFEPLLSTLGAQIVRYDQLGIMESRTGNRSVNTAPRNTYMTKDGRWIAVAASTNEIAARIVTMCGRPDLAEAEWFSTGIGRVKNSNVIDEVVGKWIGERTVEEVMAAVEIASVTFAPIYNIPEMMADSQVLAREMITAISDDELGTIRMPNVLFRLSKTPGQVKWAGPRLGSSTDAILGGELGIDSAELDSLRERGLIV